MAEDKKRINIWIPTALYTKLAHTKSPSMTEAVIKALESFFDNKDIPKEIKEDTSEQIGSSQGMIEDFKAQVEFLAQQLHIQDDQIKKLNEKKEDTSEQIGNLQGRIGDFKAQVELLAQQLHMKDTQLKDQNENMHKQAVHIQTLIQEISQLNVKLLPESTKKPWYKFW